LNQYPRRQTAYKLGISTILNSEFVRSGTDPNYLDVNGKEVCRMNIAGVVVQKSEVNDYFLLVVDDGSGRIPVRVEDRPNNFDVGDFVVIIGRPREFFSEKYVAVEIIRKLDSVWGLVRRLELGRERQEPRILETESINGVYDDPKNRILKMIRNLDKGDGVSVEDISVKLDDFDRLVDTLLREGDVFEIKPGRLKVLE
jgi:hypothetical protein